MWVCSVGLFDFVPVAHGLVYCSFIWSLDTESWCRDCFGYSRPFAFTNTLYLALATFATPVRFYLIGLGWSLGISICIKLPSWIWNSCRAGNYWSSWIILRDSRGTQGPKKLRAYYWKLHREAVAQLGFNPHAVFQFSSLSTIYIYSWIGHCRWGAEKQGEDRCPGTS